MYALVLVPATPSPITEREGIIEGKASAGRGSPPKTPRSEAKQGQGQGTVASDGELGVWFSRFYTEEGNDVRSVVRAKALAKRIRQEQQMSLRGLADAEDGKSGKDLSVRGVFSVSHARLFATPKAVVWQCSGAAIGALVCEKHVNILLAANQLGLVLGAACEHFGDKALAGPELIYNTPEEFQMVIDCVLPHGCLQFLSEDDVRAELNALKAELAQSKMPTKAR